MPERELVDIVDAGGASRMADRVGGRSQSRARDAGCDVIVAQGIEAGGHVRGTLGLLPLLDEVRSVVDLPVIAAGGIGTGHRRMAAALAAGADAVRVGTRFIVATESMAHPAVRRRADWRDRGGHRDHHGVWSGWPDAPHRVSSLRLRRATDSALHIRGLRIGHSPHTPAPPRPASYAAQSVGAVRSRQTAAEIVAELVEEAEQQLIRR